MLEDTRKRGATILIYLVFGMLIVIFAISFGPQSVGSRQGCRGPASTTQVTIADTEYGMNTWRWALNNMSGGAYEARARGALDALIRREMLAQEAERRGLVIADSVVDEKLKNGELWVLGQKVDGKRIYFEDGEFFNYKMLMQNVVGRVGLSIGAFKSEQRRELLASAMEQILAAGGRASKDEVYALWLHSERTVTFDAVTFSAAEVAKTMKLTDADVDRFLAAHGDAVKARFEADKGTKYTATVPSVHVRRAMVMKPESKATPDAGKAKLEAARAEIVAKKKTLAEVDPEGDLGWKPADAPGLPFPELDEAMKKLTAGGEPSPVIETATAWWLLQIEEKREGDLTFDQVKREIARALATEVWSHEAARRQAVAALDAAKASGKKLEELYEKAPEKAPKLTPEQMQQQREMQIQQMRQQLEDPNTSPEEKQQIEQILQLLESGQLGIGESWESDEIPVDWQAGPGAPAAPAAGAATAPPQPKPAEPKIDASKDQLPAFTPPKPQVQRIGPMPRDRERIVDLGKSKDLNDALFGPLAPGQLADHIFEVKTTETTIEGHEIGDADAFVIAQLIERVEPDPAKFQDSAEDMVQREKEDRGQELVRQWLEGRCNDLVERKEIKISNDVLQARDDKGQVKAFQYGACSNL